MSTGEINFRSQKNNLVQTTDFCEIHLNFLAHAQTLELDIGSQCGGHGKCGKDRIKIDLEKQKLLSPLSHAELKHLTEAERAEGYRLACQVFPNDENGKFTALFD